MFSIAYNSSSMEIDKKQYLLNNGWWAQYHPDCWFESSKDSFYIKDGLVVGFRHESEGITLEKAFKEAYEK